MSANAESEALQSVCSCLSVCLSVCHMFWCWLSTLSVVLNCVMSFWCVCVPAVNCHWCDYHRGWWKSRARLPLCQTESCLQSWEECNYFVWYCKTTGTFELSHYTSKAVKRIILLWYVQFMPCSALYPNTVPYMLWLYCLSVRLSVCLSVTLVICVKTLSSNFFHHLMIPPPGSPTILVVSYLPSLGNSDGDIFVGHWVNPSGY